MKPFPVLEFLPKSADFCHREDVPLLAQSGAYQRKADRKSSFLRVQITWLMLIT